LGPPTFINSHYGLGPPTFSETICFYYIIWNFAHL